MIGELSILIGGDAEALADVADLLSALSNHVMHLGGIGAGSLAKLINNSLFSAQIVLADDAMRAGKSLGVDPAGLADVLSASSSACIASGVRLGAGSMAGIVGTPGDLSLTKDVELMAALLGDAGGKELVEVAQRFVASMQAARAEQASPAARATDGPRTVHVIRPGSACSVLRVRLPRIQVSSMVDAPWLMASTASRRLSDPKGEPPVGSSLPQIQVGPSARWSRATRATSSGSASSP